jgi:hypothetical protein
MDVLGVGGQGWDLGLGPAWVLAGAGDGTRALCMLGKCYTPSPQEPLGVKWPHFHLKRLAASLRGQSEAGSGHHRTLFLFIADLLLRRKLRKVGSLSQMNYFLRHFL